MVRFAVFSLRAAASFRNQSRLIHRAAIKKGWTSEERDLMLRAQFRKDRFDRTVVLAPLWPRYIFDSVRLASPWMSRRLMLYGPVDGPYLLNVNLFQVMKNFDIYTTSRWCKRQIEESGVHCKGVVSHGIDPLDFEFSDDEKYNRLEMLRRQYPGRTIFFSNINPLHRKGLVHLARALLLLNTKKRRDWVFILHTGKFKAVKNAPALAKTPNLVIEDAYNKLPFRAVALKTKSCDVFVWPSQLEGFGLPVLEAMAAGKPIVCLNVAPMNELVGPKEAFMFESTGIKKEKWQAPGCVAILHEYRAEELARAMIRAMDNPEAAREKGLNAKKRSERYHFEKVYEPFVRR